MMVSESEKAEKQQEFESLLDASVKPLQQVIKENESISGDEFEKKVVAALLYAATNTSFAGNIRQTAPREFPDVTATTSGGMIFGVEVKKTAKDEMKASGNSIFEQSRVEGIEKIYILIASATNVDWWHYEEVLENIVVTHSPRYSINAEATQTVFSKMEIQYDDFRKLPQEKKMVEVKKLYSDSALWWLFKQQQTPNYRFLNSLTPTEKTALYNEAMVLCPECFNSKFEQVSVYALSKGIIIPNVRDEFSAGGQWVRQEERWPRIYKRVYENRKAIAEICESMDKETIEHFWGAVHNDRPVLDQWLDRAYQANTNYDIKSLFQNGQ